MITLQQFQQMIPSNKEAASWYDIAVDFFEKYDINTTNRIASFMAQTSHESNDFRSLEENLNYSVEALLRVFPRYFGAGKADPAQYARNPEKIANYVYMDANRSKNGALGNTRPGDGWRFRGGGIKQLTGRTNFTTFGKDLGMTAEEAADYVRTKKGAFESACWFWKKNGLAKFADADDIDGMSKRVNGGTIGIEDRRARYRRAKTILGSSNSRPATAFPTAVNDQITDSVTQKAPGKYPTLQRRSSGDLVRRVQQKLGLAADGIFGVQTEVAVRSWQRSNKYTSNGVLTDEQIRKLIGA
jgi:putative chitinase